MITSSAARRWPRMRRNHISHRRGALLGAVAALSGAGIAVTLAAGPAGAQTTPAPPQPGATLAAIPGGPVSPLFFYTGTDRHAWEVDLSNMAQHVPEPLGGSLIGGPAATFVPPGVVTSISGAVVFGRGTDNRLWWLDQTRASRWASLGGKLTSKPSAAVTPGSVHALARGTDGAVWDRVAHTTPAGQTVWEPWVSMGGRLLPGTAPVAAYSSHYGLVVAAVGIDRAVWVKYLSDDGQRSWHSIGGLTTGDPGLATPAASAVVAFARGVPSGAGWYKEFLGHTSGVTAGWHTLGGTLTSGVTAITAQPEYQAVVSVFALGPDNKPMDDSGTWPALSGWTPVPIG
jgi:hypothetical protein